MLTAWAAAGADVYFVLVGERRPTGAARPDVRMLARCLELVEQEAGRKRSKLTPAKRAAVVAMVYEHAAAHGAVEPDAVARFLALAR
jgi:hypothetical protein